MKNEALPVDVSLLTPEQKAALLNSLQKEQTEANNKRRDAYEGLRKDYVKRVCEKVLAMEGDVSALHKFVTDESMAFFDVMKEYGQLRREGQLSYQVTEEDFRIEVKTNKVKKFDERADVAATRLMEFLEKWIEDSEKGTSAPMYQLGMTLLERNQQGDLDYKPHYWDRWQADKINNQSVANILVDWVWASGAHGIKKPQTLLGVKADGIVGPKTLQAINDYPNQKELFDKIKAIRIQFVDDICKARPTNNKFKKGWLNRINAIKYS